TSPNRSFLISAEGVLGTRILDGNEDAGFGGGALGFWAEWQQKRTYSGFVPPALLPELIRSSGWSSTASGCDGSRTPREEPPTRTGPRIPESRRHAGQYRRTRSMQARS